MTAILAYSIEKQTDNDDDIFYDLAYDDLDALIRTSGVMLPDFG